MLAAPILKYHNDHEVLCKTIKGVYEWRTQMVAGAYPKVISGIWMLFHCVPVIGVQLLARRLTIYAYVCMVMRQTD